MIPVSVLIATKNEAARIEKCLHALDGFSEIIVIDSNSADDTAAIARAGGAQVVNFTWDGRYPKKRQWALDNLQLRHDWVFFVDADEIITPALKDEIAALFTSAPSCAGYFVRGQYVRGGRALRFGLMNSKLALFDRSRVAFPVIDDLDIPGMGEIEGHYQPVLKERASIGALRNALLHDALDDSAGWRARHERYAAWERGMNARGAWPRDPVAWRQALKRAFRAAPGRGLIAFAHSYVMKAGFLDGGPGFAFARDRYRYYRMIEKG